MYAPGESPFHVRGSTYIRMREYAGTQVPGGMEAVAGALPEGPHRIFALQAFTAGDWYDALPIRPITETVARLEGCAWEDSVRAYAESIAHQDIGLLGRVRLRTAKPERVVDKLQNAALETFDFGQAEVEDSEPNRAKIAFHEVPQPLGTWFLAMMQGYASVLIIKSGGKQPEISGRLIPKGRREHMGLVEVRIELSWGR